MEYTKENELTLTAFLWAKWLEQDGDSINIVIITPDREAQKARIKEYLENACPSRAHSGRDSYYKASVLAEAWFQLTRADKPVEQGAHEATKLKLVPALPDVMQKGEYLGRFELQNRRPDSIVALHFFSGLVSLENKMLTMGVPVIEDDEGNKFYELGIESDDETPDHA